MEKMIKELLEPASLEEKKILDDVFSSAFVDFMNAIAEGQEELVDIEPMLRKFEEAKPTEHSILAKGYKFFVGGLVRGIAIGRDMQATLDQEEQDEQ